MSVSAVVFIVGAIFLAIGLIGGGITFGVKEGVASIPKMNNPGRILAFVIGLGFIGFGLWRDLYPSSPVPTATPPAQMTTTPPDVTQPSRPTPTQLLPTATAPTPLQSPWDILLSNWQETPPIVTKYGDKTVVAAGPFIFKVISSKGNYCGVVTPRTTLDSVKEFGTPLLEHWPTTRDNLIAYLTMSDGKNNDSYDMEDFCLDPPVYTFVILHETNGAITMQKMNLPILPGP